MKKPLIFLLVLCLVSQVAFAAGGIGIYPLGDGRVEIAGEKNPAAETTVVLFDESTGEIIGITQVGAGEGEFSEVLNISDSPDGAEYVVRIDGEDSVIKNIAGPDAVLELQTAPLNEVENVLTMYSRIFDIDITLLQALVDKSVVIEVMEEETFADEEDVKSKYDAAIEDEVELEIAAALQMIADGEAEEALVSYIGLFDVDSDAYDELSDKALVYGKLNGNTYEKEEMEAAFAEYLLVAQIAEAVDEEFVQIVSDNEGLLGIDASEIEEAVFEKLESKRDYDDLADVGMTFLKESALYKVNHATKETIQTVLQNNNDVLGLLDIDGYDDLSPTQKTSACKALVGDDGANYASAEALYGEFEILISRAKNNTLGNYVPPTVDDDEGSTPSIGFGAGTGGGTTPLTPTESDLPFTDLTKSHWGYSSIYALYKKGIVSGTSATTVEPDRSVTREEFIKMLVMTFGLYDETAENVFADIPAGDWSEKYVASAYKAGITQGNGGNTFGKGQYITRQDMVVMAARCAEAAGYKLEGEAESFKDEAGFAEYAKESIYKMAGAKIVNGVGEGNFSPLTSCTRAMAAKVCNELIKIGGAAQ